MAYVVIPNTAIIAVNRSTQESKAANKYRHVNLPSDSILDIQQIKSSAGTNTELIIFYIKFSVFISVCKVTQK